jgi:hypothetical protein
MRTTKTYLLQRGRPGTFYPDFRRGSQITNVLDESYLKVGCLIHNNG